MNIRDARPGEADRVVGLFETALLEVDPQTVQSIVDDEASGSVLVAIGAETGRILGALLLQDGEIEAIAVRPNRRGQGIGRALVERAAECTDGPLVAEFDPAVTTFYAALGFEMERVEDGRYRGRLSEEPG